MNSTGNTQEFINKKNYNELSNRIMMSFQTFRSSLKWQWIQYEAWSKRCRLMIPKDMVVQSAQKNDETNIF